VVDLVGGVAWYWILQNCLHMWETHAWPREVDLEWTAQEAFVTQKLQQLGVVLRVAEEVHDLGSRAAKADILATVVEARSKIITD
ncbi:hypothetical protein, partial [Klebsiella pneumoniae]